MPHFAAIERWLFNLFMIDQFKEGLIIDHLSKLWVNGWMDGWLVKWKDERMGMGGLNLIYGWEDELMEYHIQNIQQSIRLITTTVFLKYSKEFVCLLEMYWIQLIKLVILILTTESRRKKRSDEKVLTIPVKFLTKIFCDYCFIPLHCSAIWGPYT